MYQLQNLCSGLAESIRRANFLFGDEPERAYTVMSKIVLQGLNIATFQDMQTNALLAQIGMEVQTLIKEIDRLLDAHITESTALLSNAMHVVEQTKPDYIVLCDCLSISEFLFLIHMLRNSLRNDRILCAANPSGMTSTFKYLARNYLNIPVLPDDVIMRTVGAELRKRLSAYNYILFREVDTFVHHSEGFQELETLIARLSKISQKLYSKTQSLVKTEHKVLLMAATDMTSCLKMAFGNSIMDGTEKNCA